MILARYDKDNDYTINLGEFIEEVVPPVEDMNDDIENPEGLNEDLPKDGENESEGGEDQREELMRRYAEEEEDDQDHQYLGGMQDDQEGEESPRPEAAE